MIYFLTKRTDHNEFIYKSQKITVESTLNRLKEILQLFVLGFDTEYTTNRYFHGEIILIQIGNKENQVVIDFTEPDYLNGWRKEVINTINSLLTPKHLFIGHNLKADFNKCQQFNINLPDFFDTMIAGQRINLGSGLLNNLKDVYERLLKKFMPEDKETRKDFVYMNRNSKLQVRHIMYAAGDIGEIIQIASIYKEMMNRTNQTWFIRNVEFPLIKVLGEAELKGLYLNEEKWLNLINTKKNRRFNLEKECDQEIVKLGKGNLKLLGGRFNLNRKTAAVVQPNFFDTNVVEIENKNVHNINYNSTPQIIDVIERLGLPKVTVISKDKSTKERIEKNSLKEEAIQSYLIKHRDSPLRDFFEKLLEYKGLQKFISSYGEKFLKSYVTKEKVVDIGFKNPLTGRVHTQLKQCFTDNGRLSSGEDRQAKKKKDKKQAKEEAEKKMGVFNIQNLPAEKEVRECFELSPQELLEDFWFTTIDWSGAELTIMAAMADDQKLFELGADRIINGVKVEGDMHSPTATKCWRAVYQYRKKVLTNANRIGAYKNCTDQEIWLAIETKMPETITKFFEIQDSKGKKYTLTEDFLIDKKNNKQLRTDFKPMIFGCIYGLMAKKGGETLNIPKEEAQVVIDVIKAEFPKVFKLVEGFANFALTHGYVLFNTRSNNRRVFTPVMEVLAGIDTSKYTEQQILNYVKSKLDFSTIADIEKEARNSPISGTQADMLKESLVEIRRHNDYNAVQASILLSVHDENGIMHKGKEFGETCKNIMIDTANKYLEIYSKNIRMGADCHILKHWTK